MIKKFFCSQSSPLFKPVDTTLIPKTMFQLTLNSPTTMWGMVKRAFQLCLLMLVELPIRLLMLLIINVLGLILPELVVWMARTIMIRHARSSY